MLQHRVAERCELDHDAGRQTARIERKVAATKTRGAAERRGDVPDGGQMPHFIGRHCEDGPPPAIHGFGLRRGQSLPGP